MSGVVSGAIREWVTDMTLIIILFSCLELLLPGGTMRSYMKFVFSLILLAVMTAPLSAAVLPQTESVSGRIPVSEENRSAGSSEQNQEQEKQPADRLAPAQNSLPDDRLTQVQTKQIARVYEEKLTEQLVRGLQEKFTGITVQSVEIYINNENRSDGYGRPEKAAVAIDDPEIAQEVAAYTAELLHIKTRNVTVTVLCKQQE